MDVDFVLRDQIPEIDCRSIKNFEGSPVGIVALVVNVKLTIRLEERGVPRVIRVTVGVPSMSTNESRKFTSFQLVNSRSYNVV